ncbi:IS5 family transposase [Spirochaetia bacterium]|nr:IS5 family transposase [Spirochaetia bacterium]
MHDFRIYKETIADAIDPSIRVEADLGYLGIEKLHENSRIPKKASKKHKLTKREKEYNRRLARRRVVIEHINAKIKTFKIMAYPYRNHCHQTEGLRHLLRMSLICGFINFELHVRK